VELKASFFCHLLFSDKYEVALQLEKECLDSSGVDASKPLGRGLRRKRKSVRVFDVMESSLPSMSVMAAGTSKDIIYSSVI
jgi:hypothetical protein